MHGFTRIKPSLFTPFPHFFLILFHFFSFSRFLSFSLFFSCSCVLQRQTKSIPKFMSSACKFSPISWLAADISPAETFMSRCRHEPPKKNQLVLRQTPSLKRRIFSEYFAVCRRCTYILRKASCFSEKYRGILKFIRPWSSPEA